MTPDAEESFNKAADSFDAYLSRSRIRSTAAPPCRWPAPTSCSPRARASLKRGPERGRERGRGPAGRRRPGPVARQPRQPRLLSPARGPVRSRRRGHRPGGRQGQPRRASSRRRAGRARRSRSRLKQEQKQGAAAEGENPLGGRRRLPRRRRRARHALAATDPAPLPKLSRPGPLAQLVEQETLNLKVTGSIPVRPILTAPQPPLSPAAASAPFEVGAVGVEGLAARPKTPNFVDAHGPHQPRECDVLP